MPYVQRDLNKKIIGTYANAQLGYAEEYLPDDNAEIVALTAPSIPTNAELLAETDKYMSRASEDLIVTLLGKSVITKADYPQLVWDRINYRRGLRNQTPI
jgi:hypothetical protein